MGSPCLVVLGVAGKRHWQHADLGCQHLQHGRWHIARIRQEAASPAQGQSWTLKPSLLLAPRHRATRSEEHTSELQSHSDLVCRLLLEKKKKNQNEIKRSIYRKSRIWASATAEKTDRRTNFNRQDTSDCENRYDQTQDGCSEEDSNRYI